MSHHDRSLAQQSGTINDDDDIVEEDEEIPMESNISKTLSDKNTRIVIILVLVLLIILPLFDSGMYLSTTTLHEQGLKIISGVYDGNDWSSYQMAVKFYVDQTYNLKYPLSTLQIPDPYGAPFNFNIVNIDGAVNVNSLR